MECDFSGYVTRNDIKCADGRTIRKDAFKECDGKKVPLVWNHQHNDPENVLGHAILENREDGTYGYGFFNDTEKAKMAKNEVVHGDIDAMSIWANNLKQSPTRDVLHGIIREVSLVLAGANPGAFIDTVMCHSADDIDNEDEAYIYSGTNLILEHSYESKESSEKMEETKDVTIGDVLKTFSEDQKKVMYALIQEALGKNDDSEDEENDNNEGDNEMKHNVFDEATDNHEDVISHDEMTAVINDLKRYGNMKDAALAHGIESIDYLFPEAKTQSNVLEYKRNDNTWVNQVMTSVHHTPFSRIKSIFADITGEEARAKGYVKGNLKMEEVFTLLKRTTTPTTVYKKQKLDRDDIVDITDFDILGSLKTEMRSMLDEELARAYLIGDGRSSSSDDKIDETHIRPIWTDEDLYTVKATVSVATADTDETKAKNFIKQCIKSRKDYKGSGNPTLYTTEDMIANMLLIEDTTGRSIYDSVNALCTKLRVNAIVSVPAMESKTRTANSKTYTLMGIIVNMNDYNVGADKGGAVNMFDDFDIDYNQQKYLIETRCSGALVKPYAAIAIESCPAT